MHASGESTSAAAPSAERYIYVPSAQSLGVLACGLREQTGPTGEIELHPKPRGRLNALILAVLVSGFGFGVAYAFSSAASSSTVSFWAIGLIATIGGVLGGLVLMGLSRQHAPYAPLLSWNPATGEIRLDAGRVSLRRDEIQDISFGTRTVPFFHGAEGNVIVEALVITTTDNRQILALPLPHFSGSRAAVESALSKINAR